MTRSARASVYALKLLVFNGLSIEDAERVFLLWLERAERLGPYRCRLAAHRLDHAAQQVLQELEHREDEIYRSYWRRLNGGQMDKYAPVKTQGFRER